MAKAAKRIYVVRDNDGREALVKAVSGPAALARIAKAQFSVAVASQDELVALVSAGVLVLETGDDDNAQGQ